MAFWLSCELNGDVTQWDALNALARTTGMVHVLFGGTLAQQAKFATLIRSRFNSDGTRRKKKVS